MKKILVAIDGSEASYKALTQAESWAQQELHLLHVGPISLLDLAQPRVSMLGEDILPKQIQERLEANGRKLLDDACGRVKRSDLKVETHLVLGHPGEAITLEAEEGNYDCVVVGSSGHGKVRKFFLGSVSDYVVRHCHRPVLVVRLEEA